MGAVTKAVKKVTKAVTNVVGDVIDSVGHAVEDVAKGVGNVIDSVGSTVSNFVDNLANDPVSAIATVASIAFPEFAPLIMGANTAAHGGDVKDIALSAATAWAGAEAGKFVGAQVAGSGTAATAAEAATAAQYGTTMGSAQTQMLAAQEMAMAGSSANLAARTVSGVAAAGASSVARQLVSTGEIDTNAVLAALTTAGVSGGVSMLTSAIPGFDAMPAAVQKAATSAIAAELMGRDPTEAAVQGALYSGLGAIGTAAKEVPNYVETANKSLALAEEGTKYDTVASDYQQKAAAYNAQYGEPLQNMHNQLVSYVNQYNDLEAARFEAESNEDDYTLSEIADKEAALNRAYASVYAEYKTLYAQAEPNLKPVQDAQAAMEAARDSYMNNAVLLVNPEFDSKQYLADHADAVASGMSAAEHYLTVTVPHEYLQGQYEELASKLPGQAVEEGLTNEELLANIQSMQTEWHTVLMDDLKNITGETPTATLTSDELEAMVAEAERERDNIRAQIEELTGEPTDETLLVNLREDLTTAQTEADLRAEIEDLTGKRTDDAATIEDLRNQLTELQGDATTERESLSARIEMLTGKQADATATIDELRQQLTDATSAKDQLSSQIEALTGEKTSAYDTIEDLQAQLSAATDERESLSARIEMLTGKQADATATIGELQDQLTSAADEKSALSAQIEALTGEKTSAYATIDDLQQQLSSATDERAALSSKIEDLTGKQADATATIGELRDQLQAAGETQAGLTGQVEDLTSQLSTAQQSAMLEDKISELTGFPTASGQSLDSLQQQLQQLQGMSPEELVAYKTNLAEQAAGWDTQTEEFMQYRNDLYDQYSTLLGKYTNLTPEENLTTAEIKDRIDALNNYVNKDWQVTEDGLMVNRQTNIAYDQNQNPIGWYDDAGDYHGYTAEAIANGYAYNPGGISEILPGSNWAANLGKLLQAAQTDAKQKETIQRYGAQNYGIAGALAASTGTSTGGRGFSMESIHPAEISTSNATPYADSAKAATGQADILSLGDVGGTPVPAGHAVNRDISQDTSEDSDMQYDPYNWREGGVIPNLNFGYADQVQAMANGGIASLPAFAQGGATNLGSYSDGGQLLRGPGTGLSDNIPATIEGTQPARLAAGEFVVPADVVSALGGGSTEAGAKVLYDMLDRIRHAAHGKTQQIRKVNPNKVLPK